ncbi:MAG: glycosyltransferase [Rhodobacteraceae bacterium]|nr:MAG: glycosyltransferase [Paracoccaceae bacterium]
MRAPISVILPTLNAGADLPACLMALGEGLGAGVIRELIVSDGGSSDATLQIAEAAGARIVTGPAARAEQLRRGAAAAEGEWLLFLEAGSALAPGWTGPVLRHLMTDRAAAFRLASRSAQPLARLAAGWANLRSRLLARPSAAQGLLIRRALYETTGGYRDLPEGEDLGLASALRGRLVLLPARVTMPAAARGDAAS